jgi:hypothetical protein
MIVRHVDEKTPITDILDAADGDGVLVDRSGPLRYAVIPLDDDLIDYLLERNPKFRADCEAIREEMRAGRFTTLDDAEKLLG